MTKLSLRGRGLSFIHERFFEESFIRPLTIRFLSVSIRLLYYPFPPYLNLLGSILFPNPFSVFSSGLEQWRGGRINLNMFRSRCGYSSWIQGRKDRERMYICIFCLKRRDMCPKEDIIFDLTSRIF